MKPAWHYIALRRVGGGYAIFRALICSWLSCRCGPTSNEISLEALATTTWNESSNLKFLSTTSTFRSLLQKNNAFPRGQSFYILCTKSNQRNLILNTCTTSSSSSVVSLPRSKKWDEVGCVPPYFSMVSWLGVYQQQQQHHATFNDLEKPFNRTRSSSSPPSDVSWLNSGVWWLQINDGVSFFLNPWLGICISTNRNKWLSFWGL